MQLDERRVPKLQLADSAAGAEELELVELRSDVVAVFVAAAAEPEI